MAESDSESKNDEIERGNLQRAISEVEAALTASTTGTRAVLQNFLQNAKGRVATLDKKIKDSETEKESHTRDAVAVAYLAQKEAALSDSEKQTYSGFLEKEFFTKRNFAALEQFYAHTWDRLSEGGKDQMSHRIWEGIRHKEYTFSELPERVRDKEEERVYRRLTESSIASGLESRIPAKDRDDFVNAYRADQKEEASKILERSSFKQSMFLEKPVKAERSSEATIGRTTERERVNENLRGSVAGVDAARRPEPEISGDLDLSSLKDVKVVDVAEPASSSELPEAKPERTSQNLPSRGA